MNKPTRALAFALGTLAAPAAVLLALAPGGCGGARSNVVAPAASGSASSSDSPAASGSDTPEPNYCLPAAARGATLAHVEAIGDAQGALLVCYGAHAAPSAPCLTVDPGTGKPSASSTWTRPANAPSKHRGVYASPADRKAAYTVDATATELSVCKAGTNECRKVRPGYAAKAGVGFGEPFDAKDAATIAKLTKRLIAAASEDGKRLFVLDVESKKGGGGAAFDVFGDTFDVDGGKRLARTQLVGGSGASNAVADPGALFQLAWIGDRLWLAGYDAKDTTSAQELLDPVGGAMLDLGAPSFFVPEGNVWVAGLASPDGDLVKLVEPKSLSNLAKFPLPSTTIAAEPTRGLLRAVRRPDGKVWVAFANPPGTVVIDTGRVDAMQPVALPICP